MENTNIQVEKHSNMSPTIGKLAEALSKAQAVMEGAERDAENPFFKNEYSSLTSVWSACRKPLSDNGLAVVQTCESETPDIVIVETMLVHLSGEWIRGRVAMKPVKPDPQGIGSCITYARRYSLAAMCGVSPEDDDGNAATQGANSKEPAKKATEPANPIDGDKQHAMQKDIGGWLCEMHDGILGAEEQLEILTEWTNKEGKKIPGKKSVFDLATKPNAKGLTQTGVVHRQVRQLYEEWQQSVAKELGGTTDGLL